MIEFTVLREEKIYGRGALCLIEASSQAGTHWQVEWFGGVGAYENHQYKVKKNAENKFEYELFILKKCEIPH